MPDRRSNRAPTVTIIQSGEDRILIDESELRRRLEVERALAYAEGYRDGFAAGQPQGDLPRVDPHTLATGNDRAA